MPLPNDPAYYADCYDLFAKALAAPHGVQKICHSEDEARAFRSRLHQARALSRQLSKKVYAEDHPLHNTSEYYRITARIVFDEKRSLWLLRLEKRELRNEEIEEIMPAEIEAIPPAITEEKRLALAWKPQVVEVEDTEDLAEDAEFNLEPETNLDPSPERTDRPRRF